MLTHTITGLDEARKKLRAHTQQLPFALSKALNETGREVIRVEQGVMGSVFDRPRPFTVGSLRLNPATKFHLVAEVLPKNAAGTERSADRWLAPEVFGGPRREKAFERSMRAAGILPQGMYIVPGAAAKLDGFGNWSRSHMNSVLTAMRMAGTKVAARRIEKLRAKGKATASQRYFVLQRPENGLEPGIYERRGSKANSTVEPIAVFTRSLPIYRRRFPFDQVAQRVAGKEFSPRFDRALAEAIATAR